MHSQSRLIWIALLNWCKRLSKERIHPQWRNCRAKDKVKDSNSSNSWGHRIWRHTILLIETERLSFQIWDCRLRRVVLTSWFLKQTQISEGHKEVSQHWCRCTLLKRIMRKQKEIKMSRPYSKMRSLKYLRLPWGKRIVRNCLICLIQTNHKSDSLRRSNLSTTTNRQGQPWWFLPQLRFKRT